MSKPQSQLNQIAQAIVKGSKSLSSAEQAELALTLQKQIERLVREQKVAKADLKDMEKGLDLASLYNEIGENILILRHQAEDLRLKHRELDEVLELTKSKREAGSVKKEQEKVEVEHDKVMAELEEFELKQAELKPALVKCLSGFRFKSLDAIKVFCQQTKIKLAQLDQRLVDLQKELNTCAGEESKRNTTNVSNLSITIDNSEQAHLMRPLVSKKV